MTSRHFWMGAILFCYMALLIGAWLYFFPAGLRTEGHVPAWATTVLLILAVVGVFSLGAVFSVLWPDPTP
jgi:hypothetical protein